MDNKENENPPVGSAARHTPWVTFSAAVASAVIFAGLAVKNDYESWETLALFGYLPVSEIRSGALWALVTSAFVHFEPWHVGLNVYWLWVLGSRLERQIGVLPYIAFFVVSAFVSSAFQVAVSDSTGIGASGVVYAIFGFMWSTRRIYPAFAEVLDWRTVQLFLVWLAGCVVATYLEVLNVGNAAHLSGLLFGVLVARGFAAPRFRGFFRAGALVLIVAGCIPLVWCPWSPAWLSESAYEAHLAQDYELAIQRYSALLRRQPENAWAWLNRSIAHRALGNGDQAAADLARAREIDPHIEGGD